MQQNEEQQTSHAGRVARRAFIKKAAIGAVFAVPAIETVTKSDILVKSALAATVQTWIVEAEVLSGPGTVSPPSQKIPNGGSAFIQVTPDPMHMVTGWQYQITRGTGMMTMWEMASPAEEMAGGITVTGVTANVHVDVQFFEG